MKCGAKSLVLKKWQKAKQLKQITRTKISDNLNMKSQEQMHVLKISRKLLNPEATTYAIDRLLLMTTTEKLQGAKTV